MLRILPVSEHVLIFLVQESSVVLFIRTNVLDDVDEACRGQWLRSVQRFKRT